MTIPKFASVEEADKWLVQQRLAVQRDDWLEAHDEELFQGECVRWSCEDGKTLVSYTKAKVGKLPRYVCVVRRSGRVIYIRAFAKRKDAKNRALTEYAKSSPRWAKRNGRA